MVIIQLAGGLGNQMFQYAFGRSLAHRLNTQLKLDISSYRRRKQHGYSLHHFRIHEDVITGKELAGLVPLSKLQIFVKKHFGIVFSSNLYLERSFCFDPDTLKLSDNTFLVGYWQSERYFADIADTIRNEYRPKSTLSNATLSISEQMTVENAVSIHVRRGDYIREKKILSKHGVCDIEYYKRSVSHIFDRVPEPRFYLFSDEPEWVREHFLWLEPKVVVNHNDTLKNYEDLWLMSQCKHNIIANSSFSWWGAWLNNNPGKVIIAPVKWFADNTIDTNDLLPHSWERLRF